MEGYKSITFDGFRLHHMNIEGHKSTMDICTFFYKFKCTEKTQRTKSQIGNSGKKCFVEQNAEMGPVSCINVFRNTAYQVFKHMT